MSAHFSPVLTGLPDSVATKIRREELNFEIVARACDDFFRSRGMPVEVGFGYTDFKFGSQPKDKDCLQHEEAQTFEQRFGMSPRELGLRIPKEGEET